MAFSRPRIQTCAARSKIFIELVIYLKAYFKKSNPLLSEVSVIETNYRVLIWKLQLEAEVLRSIFIVDAYYSLKKTYFECV